MFHVKHRAGSMLAVEIGPRFIKLSCM